MFSVFVVLVGLPSTIVMDASFTFVNGGVHLKNVIIVIQELENGYLTIWDDVSRPSY